MRGITLSAVLGIAMWLVIIYTGYVALERLEHRYSPPKHEPYTVMAVSPAPPPPRAYVDEIAPNVYRIHDPETGVVCYRHGTSNHCAISCVIPPQWHTAAPYED